MHLSRGLAIFTSFDGLGVLCGNPITAETLHVLYSSLKRELCKVLKVVGIDNGEIVVQGWLCIKIGQSWRLHRVDVA